MRDTSQVGPSTNGGGSRSAGGCVPQRNCSGGLGPDIRYILGVHYATLSLGHVDETHDPEMQVGTGFMGWLGDQRGIAQPQDPLLCLQAPALQSCKPCYYWLGLRLQQAPLGSSKHSASWLLESNTT